jgi:aspartate aminotransferase-like enzyme
MARETVAFGDPEFVKVFKELIEELKVLLKTEGRFLSLPEPVPSVWRRSLPTHQAGR